MESLTRPLFHHRRKLSNGSSTTTSNGLSFSGKDAYDDVLLGGPKSKFGAAAAFASRKVAAEDYAEIFGGRNGTRASSIPVLDLSDLDETNGSGDTRSSNGKLDYSTIFGGFGGGGGGGGDVAVAVPPYEELFIGVKKVKRDKAKARISADMGPPLKGSDRFNSSENNKSHSSEASDQIFDGGKQFNMSYHKTGQPRKDGSNGNTHIAELHVVPGFTYVIDETARLQKTEHDKAKLPVKVEVSHNQSSSGHLQKTQQDKAMPPFKAEVIHYQSSSVHLQKLEQDKAMPSFKAEVGHNRSSSVHLQKMEQDKALPSFKAEVGHNRSSSVHLQKMEQDKVLPSFKAEVGHNQSSSDRLQETEQDKAMPSVKAEVNHNWGCSHHHLQKTEQDKAMPPVKVEINLNSIPSDDISEGKSGRAKWQLPTTQAPESFGKDKGKYIQDASLSSNKLFNMEEPEKKSHPSQVPFLSSSSANLNESKGHPNRSKSSSYGPKVEASEKVATGYSTPFSDEELDVNSAAAASAAALKKAIEQAQESIRIAKEIMERKRDYVQSSKSRSKGSLKAKDRREIKHVQEVSNTRENNVNEACASVDNEVLDFFGRDENLGLRSGEVASSLKDTDNPASLKAKDRREIKHVQEVNNTRENNVNEACASVDNEVRDFFGRDENLGLRSGEVASSLKDTDNPATGRQGEVATNGENVEVVEEGGVAMWFTQLLNNGKHRMAALASELVGKKNSTLHPFDKEIHNIEETKPTKLSLERDATEKVNAVDRILESGDTEAKINALGRPEELEKNAANPESSMFAYEDKVSEPLISAQEDEVTKLSAQEDEVTKNAQPGYVEEEKYEEKHEDRNETICERHFDPEKLGNGLPENELLKLKQVSFDQETGEKLQDIQVREQEDYKVDKEEVDPKQEELHLFVGNEDRLKMATYYVSSSKRQEDDSVERLEAYHEQENREQRSTQSVNGEENQIMSEEEHVWEAIDRRPAGTCQNIEADSIDEGTDNSSATQEIEVNEEVQEVDSSWARTVESAENPGANLFQEAVHGESHDTAFVAYNIDQSANLDGIQEACTSKAENSSEQNSQQESRNNEEEAHKVGITEPLYQFGGDTKAQQAVEEASTLKGEEILETSCENDSNAQENIVESTIEDVSGAGVCDDKTAEFGFTKINHEAELTETIKLTDSIYNGTKEDAIDSEEATDAPAVKDVSNFDFTEMNGQQEIYENDSESGCTIETENSNLSVDDVHGQNETEESERESESGMNPENGNGLVHESKEDAENVKVDGVAYEKEVKKDNIEARLKERECIENEKELGNFQFPGELKGEEQVEINAEMKTGQSTENEEDNVCKTLGKEKKETRENVQKEEVANDCLKRTEVNKREREREKDRIAVERAIREVRERAFAEARERAERAAVEKATAEVRQRAMAGAREKLEKVSAGTKVPTDKASTEAKLRSERAAVERATAEARERALEKALSQKTTSEMRTQAERNVSGKFSGASRDTGLKHSFSSSDLERFDGTNSESAQRRKARLERHQRIMERAAKALAEKNLRDVLAQREQAERNRLAETLDADIKRWASGKEGNLRALLSTLQYILGPSSGWQPISLTEIITTNAVKKAYRKATLYVHPDKLQQRGATIQQKYTCEKVFDLLKAAWNKFNSEER